LIRLGRCIARKLRWCGMIRDILLLGLDRCMLLPPSPPSPLSRQRAQTSNSKCKRGSARVNVMRSYWPCTDAPSLTVRVTGKGSGLWPSVSNPKCERGSAQVSVMRSYGPCTDAPSLTVRVTGKGSGLWPRVSNPKCERGSARVGVMQSYGPCTDAPSLTVRVTGRVFAR